MRISHYCKKSRFTLNKLNRFKRLYYADDATMNFEFLVKDGHLDVMLKFWDPKQDMEAIVHFALTKEDAATLSQILKIVV